GGILEDGNKAGAVDRLRARRGRESCEGGPGRIDIDGFGELAGVRPGVKTDKRIGEFEKKYRAKLTSATLRECKEICDLLEKNLKFDQEDSEIAGDLWLLMLESAAKSEPAWTIA
ncbi:MAG: hypothetical protein RLZZ214_2931, partial [Verrucomicrobiota bacterium]